MNVNLLHHEFFFFVSCKKTGIREFSEIITPLVFFPSLTMKTLAAFIFAVSVHFLLLFHDATLGRNDLPSFFGVNAAEVSDAEYFQPNSTGIKLQNGYERVYIQVCVHVDLYDMR